MKPSIFAILGQLPLFIAFAGLLYVEGYRVVRVKDISNTNRSDSLNGKVFFIHLGVASVVHHRSTWMELGFTDEKGCEKLWGKELYSWRDPLFPLKPVARYACIENVGPRDLSLYKRGPPLPSLERRERTLDESMMMEMKKIDIVQGQMVFDKMFIQFGINPSILEWRDHLLMATSLAWGIEEAPGMKASGKLPSECIEFNWVNRSSLYAPPIVHKGQYTKNLPRNQRIVYPYKGVFLGLSSVTDRLDRIVGGQDPRLVVLDENHIGMVMTERFSARRLRVGFEVIGINMTVSQREAWSAKSNVDVLKEFPTYLKSGKAAKDEEAFYAREDNMEPYGGHPSPGGNNLVVTHRFSDLETGDIAHDEKNWSPFLFDIEGKNVTKSVLFIRSINPLVIVRPLWSSAPRPGEPGEGVVPLQTVSSAKPVDTKFWSYGTLRGGTNPVLIQPPTSKKGGRKKGHNPFYLAIFHSVSTIPGDGTFKSYTMGAFTFTASRPFKLMAISGLPFMDKDLYQGAYAENWRRMYDYVVFPMTLAKETDKTLLLSFGWQDRYAMIGRLNLQAVLDTLVPVGEFAN